MIGKIRNVELGDVCDFLSGFPFKSTDFSSNPNDIFLVKGSNTGHQFIAFEVGPWLKVMDYQNYLKYELQEDDVIIAMDRPIVGDQLKYCWMKKNDPKSLLVQRMARLRGSQELDIKYLRYVIGGSEFKGYIDTITTGANVPHISGPDIKKFRFPLPPLKTQKKIAAILSAYDDLIENNLKRIKLLEEMAQITYEEWFVRMRFPGYESVPIDSTTGLPEEWKTVKLREVLQLNYGKALKAETRIKGDIPVYGSSGIVGTHKDALVEGCGIIIGRKGNVGSVFWSHDSFYPIDTVYFVTSTHTPHFLYYVLRNSKFDNSDAAVPGLNRDSAYSVEITLPSEAMERQFSERIKKNFSVIQSLEKQNQLLREARDILLPRLMTGIIDVDSYNPADLLKEVA